MGPPPTVPDGPHRRHDPLLDEWVLVSAGRASRPWHGEDDVGAEESRPAYDPDCFLCPGNRRASGERNPAYASRFVFANDFAALGHADRTERSGSGLFVAETVPGACRVLCFSPRHDLDLGGLGKAGVRGVVDLWATQSAELGRSYGWVQVFENRGAAMGASSPHPHGQVWASAALPVRAAREDANQRAHLRATGRPLLVEYGAAEIGGERVVHEDDAWLVVVPFWAAWPFETLILPRRPVRRLEELDDVARDALASALLDLLARYDGLFGRPFPYSMGWHGAPYATTDVDHWLLHCHILPPLLRADVRKFMVGYELLAEVQRDLTPEEAAARLRAVPLR
jgi:UDPglucose--hexose-1-phosphate uridylyltransferase